MHQQVPILKIDDFWIASVQGSLHDQDVIEFKQALLSKIMQPKSKGLIIDLTVLDVVDSFVTKTIIDIRGLARLMGVPVVIVGMSPAVAITLVEMGLSLEGVDTALNLQKGLDKLRNAGKERW